jgi:diguanylate cyclase (GGDEF)-like protein
MNLRKLLPAKELKSIIIYKNQLNYGEILEKKLDRLSLNSRTIKQKLMVSFQLMFILPFLVCVYLLSIYIFPKIGFRPDILAYLGVSIFLAVVGLLVIKEVFDRLIAIATEAKYIAAGDLGRRLSVRQGDEVGELGNVLNELTNRIRNNMDELKDYGEKTTAINVEIQKKIMVLSNLMQISAMISQGGKFDEILKISAEKSRSLADSEIAFLLFKDETSNSFNMKSLDGVKSDYLMRLEFTAQEEVYKKILNVNKLLILDEQNAPAGSPGVDFLAKIQFKNCLAMPIFIKENVRAVLGIANNREKFSYDKKDIEILDIFSKQIAVAIESDSMAHRIEKLEIKDALTGLYNRYFIENRLKEEIARAIAYQRPCAYIVFDIDNFKNYREQFGLIQAEAALKRVAGLILGGISQVDRAGRTGDDEFALILPEKNKRQAQDIAEKICKEIHSSFSHDPVKLTCSAGVSENPLDGVVVEQLIAKAEELLKKAKAGGKNKVVVF